MDNIWLFLFYTFKKMFFLAVYKLNSLLEQLSNVLYDGLYFLLYSINNHNSYAVLPVQTRYPTDLDSIKNPFDKIIISLFAAEDEGKTFDPTERKIQKAREEGRVPKTQELSSSLILIAVISVLWGLGDYFMNSLSSMFRYYLQLLHSVRIITTFEQIVPIGLSLLKILIPVFVVAVVFAFFGNVVQVGWVVSFKPITPDVSRVSLNPSKWFEKIFSTQGWYTLGFTLVRLILVGSVFVFNIIFQFDDISLLMGQSFIQATSLIAKLVIFVILESAALLFVLSFIDSAFQTYLFREQLKMSRQEIKDEIKESEGDVEVKQRIQSRMREFINRNVKENVKTSDVLRTNPTHFAVALKYDRQTMVAPTVMAKGEDNIAFRMRSIAKEFDIPIIENKPLTRALHADLEVGEEIPAEYYNVVVLIFEQIYKMKGTIG